jgi:uncharacterized protein (DUF488 family)
VTKLDVEQLTVATGRYHGGLVKKSGLLPIGTTVGAAKFLPYELAANLGALAPYGDVVVDGETIALRKVVDKDAFEKAYLERLDGFGIDAIVETLYAVAKLYGVAGVVLLCFEDVIGGTEFCHRRMFADWWLEKTGFHVPELASPDAIPIGDQVTVDDLRFVA